jgi:hypothetical protein
VRAARGFTATCNARIDLLFTMSDNTRAPAEAESARIRFFRERLGQRRPAYAEASAGNLRGSKSAPLTEAALAAQVGGARRDRTDDLLLAKQALSQLSYGPAPVVALSTVAMVGLPAVARGS